MNPNRTLVGATALTLAGLMGLPAHVQAQPQAASADGTQPTQSANPSTNAAANAGGAAGELQEVVVTAERRATDLQATPIAVTALSGEQLTVQHLNDISDLQTMVPSFQSSDQGGVHNSINIRGIGNSAIVTTISTGVAVFRDGIPMLESIGQDEPMFDIADTEVLEGPQGTFVGASSTAGAVEINSANPNFNGLSGYVLGGVGSYSLEKLQGAVNLPVSDTLAARIAVNQSHQNSFFDDIGSQLAPGASKPLFDPGHDANEQARLSLLWRPTDSFQVLGKAEYSYIDTGGDPAEPNPYTYNTLFGAGPGVPTGINAGCSLSGSQLLCPGAGNVTHSPYYYSGETPYVLDYYNTNMEYNELMTRYSVELRETLPDGIVLRSLSGMVHLDLNHIESNSYGPQNAGSFIAPIGPNDNYYSEEFNVLSAPSGKLTWIAGSYWDYRSTPLTLTTQTVNTPYASGQLPSTETFIASTTTSRVAAVFGQLNWHFTDTLQLQVGARENWDNDFTENEGNVAPKAGSVLPGPDGTGVYSITYPTGSTVPSSYRVVSPISAGGRYTDTVPTGKVDLNWTPIAGQNFYAFYARGYKDGGTNQNSTDHPTFAPEHVNDYEAGWKGRLFDGHLMTQLGAYYINYQNMQYSVLDTDENNDTTAGDVVENLAPSTIYGFEVATQSRFGGLGVNLGFDYNHSSLGSIIAVPEYQLPPNFNSPIAHPQCLAGVSYTRPTSCFNYSPYLENVSGEENPFAPLITANISLDYLFYVGNGSLDPRVTFSHTDKQWASIFQDSTYNLMGARNLWNASLDWVVNKWDLQLYGTNLSNETYVVAGGNPLYYGAPRQEGVQGTYRF